MGLFGTSGIRGIYGREITPESALRLGLAISSYLRSKGKVLLGGDCRLTTHVLKLSLASGLTSGGVNVLDAGMIPLPVLTYGVVRNSLSGGIYVTASHNPPEYNGIKIFDSNGVELRSEDEMILEEIIERGLHSYVDWQAVGSYVMFEGLVDDYINDLVAKLMPRRVVKKVRVVVDAANCVTSLVTPKVLTRFGSYVQTLNSNVDGRFPGREPEPRPDVLSPYLSVVRELGGDIFLAHDGDGDRLAVIDPSEGFVKQDRLIALMFKYRLIESAGKVVASVDCGNAVKEVVDRYGGELIISKLGRIHEALIKHKAIIAAEPWKLIEPSWGYWIDSIYQAGLIVKIMMEEGKNLKQLMEDIPNFPQARYSIKVAGDLKLGLYEHLRSYLEGISANKEGVIDIDGYRVNYLDRSWILIRPSGTEPKVRIYCEARTVDRLKELTERILSKSKEYLNSKGLKLEVDGMLIP